MNVRFRFSLAIIGACALLLLYGSPASATSVTYTSTFDPSDVLFNNSGGTCTGTNNENATLDTVTGQVGGSCESLDYVHMLVGYSNPPDTLTSADLTLYFYDDNDPSNPNSSGTPESVIITFNPNDASTTSAGEVSLTNGTTTTLLFNYSVDFTVLDNGQLEVLLGLGTQGVGQNDFYFDQSVLNGTWDTDPREFIPEPASLLLFGGGLTAVAARLRKRVRNRA